ncbi:hypothetical protein Trydic_g22743 [Trypoxylus dichotomus]
MSENLDELLNVVDEENEEDYDLAADEEDALLDESYDIVRKTHTPNDIDNSTEVEQDVLDLDDETELEDSEILNSTAEEEGRCRQDKFLNERVQQAEQTPITKKFFGKQNFRGSFSNRGRWMGNRGNFHNNQNRSMQFQQRNKVLINPHFKGNVQIKHNVSLAWDKNNGAVKKPVIPIQPWAQSSVPENTTYQQNSAPLHTYVNQQQYVPPTQNSRLPVHQRLGVSTNSYNQSNNQPPFVQNFQQPNYNLPIIPQNQYPQNPMYGQPQFPSNYNNTQPQQMHPTPFHSNQSYPDYPISAPQPHFVPPFNNNSGPNVNYPLNVPVVNNEPKNINVQFYEESETQFQHTRKFTGNSPTKRRFDFKIDQKKKKRTVLISNLHEVQTVDIPMVAEEEDEEMKAYRKKIEHQKLIREKLLRQKEERRKQAAKKLQAEEEYKSLLTPKDIAKEEIPVIMNSQKTAESPVIQIAAKPVKKTQVVRISKTIVPIKTDNSLVVKRVVSTKPMSCENVSADNSESETLNKDHLSSFLSNRKIFAKDKSLADTSLVVINNLATGTSEVKLRKLCQGVGDIQNLQMSAQERQATIQFKSVASAHAFYKKYQRFMLDLSMIQVSLKPH